MQETTTLGSVSSLLAEALRQSGIDPAPLFDQAGIDISAAKDPDARVPTHRMLNLWSLAIEATDNPCIGLFASRHFQPAFLHGLGFSWLASDNLLDALNRLVRYSRLINTAIEFRVDTQAKTIDLVVVVPDLFPNYVPAGLDLGMAVFLRMCQLTTGDFLLPSHVVLQRQKPCCSEQFTKVFGPSIEYSASENRLCFDRELFTRPLTTSNPSLARINDQAVVDYLARFDRSSISMKVRASIIELLPDGMPKQDNIAETLHVSLRSLQRRLKEEKTSFKHLMDETRYSLARQYLREHHRSISEITYLLGFSEPSNFTRAFKRWTGKTPAEFRTNS